MAKKQGTSYSPNTALIQGAAAAYKNYDNAAGMYAGLEQATKAGVDTFKSVMEEKAKKAEEITRVNKLFDDAADQVLLNSGALGQTLYDSTYDELVKAKKVYLDGVNEKDDKKRIEGLKYIQNHSTWVQSHKEYITELATDKVQGNLSSYMSEKDKEIQSLIMKGDYETTSRDEETDEVVFHVNLKNGEKVKVTDSQFKDMAADRDFKFSNSYVEVSSKVLVSEDFNADLVGQTIIQNMPNTKKGMGIIMSDGILGEQGDQRNLKTMLEKSFVDGTLESEILSAIGFDITKFDKNKDGLDEVEKTNFIDAVVNTENPLFDVKTSQSIMKEQLILAAKNKHQKHWKKINDEKIRKENLIKDQNKETGRHLSYGFIKFDQMKESYDLIQSTPVGEYYEGLRGVRFLRQEDGNYLGPDGKTYTPNGVKRYEQFNHLPDFTEISNTNVLDDAFETETEKTVTEEVEVKSIAQQMLSTKRGEGFYNKFTKDQLRKALKEGNVSEDILKKYLLQVNGVTIDEKGIARGLEGVSAKSFNKAMRSLQKEEGINLGYN
tara:strand:+ start:909 stop:2555 length:1647 start_codon:yes stop_codon:yes gene_type:complete